MATAEIKIRLQSVYKSFSVDGTRVPVLEGVDFFAASGEFVSIIGPSGCGKSTLLNTVAGLEEPEAGWVELEGAVVDRRLGNVGYMQQKDLLMPWRTVLDNAILGLEVQGISRTDARVRATDLLEVFGLRGFENQYPYALSGGMRQRAAFLRTVLVGSEAMLLDEPFGALDALTRTQMQEWLMELWDSLGKTIVLVTHDVDEAIERPGIKVIAPLWKNGLAVGWQTSERWTAFADWLHENGLVQDPVDGTKAFTNEYVEALK